MNFDLKMSQLWNLIMDKIILILKHCGYKLNFYDDFQMN